MQFAGSNLGIKIRILFKLFKDFSNICVFFFLWRANKFVKHCECKYIQYHNNISIITIVMMILLLLLLLLLGCTSLSPFVPVFPSQKNWVLPSPWGQVLTYRGSLGHRSSLSNSLASSPWNLVPKYTVSIKLTAKYDVKTKF